MAGKPKTRAFEEQIAAKAKAAGVEPLDYICDRIAGGIFSYELADELGGSDAMLRRWVKAQPKGWARYIDATADRAHALAETGVKVARELVGREVTKEEIALAKLEIDQLNFIASRQNRAAYGNDAAAQVNVQLNLGDLHLDALRHRQIVVPSVPLLPAGPDVEVLPDTVAADRS